MRSPDPPRLVIAIDRARGATVVFTERDVESEPAAESSMVVDLGPDGRPVRGSDLDVHARAAVEFLERLYVFDDRGMNRIDDGVDRAKDDATLAGLVPYPGTFRADSAAAGRRRLLAAGFDVAGIPSLAEYDGVRLVDSELPRPAGFNELGGANGPARIAIVAVGDDRFVVAMCDDRRVYAARFDGRPIAPEQVSWSPPEAVRGARGVVLTESAGGVAISVERVADDGQVSLSRFDVQLDSGAPRLVARGERALEPGESQIGAFPALALESGAAGVAVARPRGAVGSPGLRALPTAVDDFEDPLAIVAWNLRASRFGGPLLAHFVLFMVLGLLLRRRVETEPRIVMYRPAPYWRRCLAVLVDASVALTISALVVAAALGPAEHRYLERVLGTGYLERILGMAASILSSGANDAITIVIGWELLLVFLIVYMATASLFEGAWGASLGKRLLGLSVVSLEGDRPALGSTLTRSALIFVDSPPNFGWIFLVLTRRRQRLGDLFAGTVVIDSKSLRVRAATRQEVERRET